MTALKRKSRSKNLDAKLGTLRSDIDALQADMKNVAGDVETVANDSVRAAKNVAERAYRLAEETASHLADDVGTWTNDNVESVRGSVRAQPLSAMFLSLGAGALLGAFFLRR